jgi:hypothetical protein
MPPPWLAMSGFVSVDSTTQTTDIFVCRQHVTNVGPTRQRHSVMLTNILAVSVVSGNFVANTFSYTYAGISTSEARSTSSRNLVPIKLLSRIPPFDQRNLIGGSLIALLWHLDSGHT